MNDDGLKQWSKNDLIREVLKLRAIVYEHANALGDEPTANPGGMVDPVGDPHARGNVIFDARNAILMDSVEVALMDKISKGQPIPDKPILALTLAGRVNKRTERASTLYFFDEDGAAAIVSELVGLAVRIGPAFALRLTARLKDLP